MQTDPQHPNRAEELAKVLAADGIESDDVPLPAKITALNAAGTAFVAIGAGSSKDWLYLLKQRKISEQMKKVVSRKFAAICLRALVHPDAQEQDDQVTAFAAGYFSKEAE